LITYFESFEFSDLIDLRNSMTSLVGKIFEAEPTYKKIIEDYS